MIKLTACLTIGIIIAHLIEILVLEILVFSASILALFFILYTISKKKRLKTIQFGLISYLTMICLGLLTYSLHNQLNWSDHYTKSNNLEDSSIVQIEIIERLKPNTFNDKYIVRVKSINQKKVSGKLLLSINRDSITKLLKVDEQYLIFTGFETIKKPLNPNQFDYQAYLKRQYVYHQISTSSQFIHPLEQRSRSLLGYASNLRNQINDQLKSYLFNKDQLAIINALFLGQRQDMSSETYKSYVEAGAIHILAISGLHIGIILIMLNRLLKPIELMRYGRPLKAFTIVILLWCFAIVAGLSASVTRAVTMFTLLTIAMHLKRPTNVYNTLSISIFFLLLFRPMFLFDVGFQMSYIAVLAIVSIQPELYKLWSPNFKPLDSLWQIFTVTVAAQVGVAPLSLFYFHQFPGLFFITNMAIIPFLGLILGFGIIVIALALLDQLPQVLASAFAQIIDVMNLIVEYVSAKDQFVIKNISFEALQLISIYVLLILLFGFIKSPRFKRARAFLVTVLLIQTIGFVIKFKPSTDTFIIFHKSRKTVIGLHHQNNLKIWHDQDTLNTNNSREIQAYCVSNFIASVDQYPIQNVYKTNERLLLVIDSLGIYNVTQFKPYYILLRNSPKINLKRVIDSLKPSQIIADGSNYKSYLKRWKATCKKQKLPFHSTYEEGAYIIE